MMKQILAFVILGFLFFTGTAQARIYQFDDLKRDAALLGRFDSAKDQILFNHSPNTPYPLIFKQTDKGIAFRLDHGAKANPRYEQLGSLAIKGCEQGKVSSTRGIDPHGSTVSLICGK